LNFLTKKKIPKLFFNLKIRLFTSKAGDEDESQKGINKASKGGIIYGEYLQVINFKVINLYRYFYWSKY